MLAKDIEQEIRADERLRIAKHLKATAINVIKDPNSDGIDGYTGAVILELADEIERNGE